jgi:hypothetical protein
MITRWLSSSSVVLLTGFCVALTFLGITAATAAGESNSFQAQLVWGTDGEKPPDKALKDVEPKLLEKFKAIFKWKNYYAVGPRKPMSVPKDGSQRLKLSDKCEIEVQDVGSSRIEIRLFGEGNLVVTHKQTVVPEEPIVLGGGSKNFTAWFVVLTPTKQP